MIKPSIARACTLAVTIPLALSLSACSTAAKPAKTAQAPAASTASPAPWAKVQNPLAPDAALEAKITEILGRLSLEHKVGQMIQPHIGAVTVDEVKRYNIGSVLNGGGQMPDNNADAAIGDWISTAERFYQASMSTDYGRTPIPIVWGIDAVHGHNNLIGATLFPHNIALGATRNPALAKALGAITASEVVASGQDWTFAPTLAAAQDDRWGRTYESFSEDSALVATFAGKVVEGIQGTPNTGEFLDQKHVLATAKHFIGDGGTTLGDDQGYTEGNEEQLLKIHLPGYITALNAGAQTVMASYSYWNGQHSHANKRLMTDLLKGQLGFDGLIVSDWQGIGHIPGCSLDNCPEAVNAGVDLFMIPNAPDWQKFHANVVEQVKAGIIPQARIDDAVRRILRVKLRLGLFTKPSPLARANAAKGVVGSPAHRAVARQAVAESLVLLKNTAGVLPIRPKANVMVAGPAANSLAMQAGGWSVTWRGNDLPNSKFPGATSIYSGIAQAVKAAGGKAMLSESGEFKQKPDVAVVLFGETPYAEMYGDIQNLQNLEIEKDNKTSLALMKKLKAQGIPVVAVLLSGRPMYVNKELNVADAFVAAWQPGTEGAGVADVLIAKADGKPNRDFTGRLSFSWPKTPCQTPLNKGDANYDPLFAFDYGLSYSAVLSPWVPVAEDQGSFAYGCGLGGTLPVANNTAFDAASGWNWYVEDVALNRKPIAAQVSLGAITAEPGAAGGEVKATWSGQAPARLVVRKADAKGVNLLPLYANKAAVVMEVKLAAKFSGKMDAMVFSGPLTFSAFDISPLLATLPANSWRTISVDLTCFTRDRVDMAKIDGAVGLQSSAAVGLEVRNPRYEVGLAKTASLSCSK